MRIAQATVGALLAAWLLIACADTQTRDDDQVPEERAPAGADDGTPSRRASKKPGPTSAKPRSGGPRADSGKPIDRYSKDSALRRQALESMAESEYQTGKRLYGELKYADAERQLLKSLQSDPNHAGAIRLLQRTQFILGKRPGEIPSVIDRLRNETEVRIQEFRIEIERTMNEGIKLSNDREFDKAAERFERAIEQMHYFPFFVDTSDIQKEAEHRLATARSMHLEKRRGIRRSVQNAAEEEARIGRALNLRQVQRRVADLMKKATEAFGKEEFEKCEEVCDMILELDHRSSRAARLREKAMRARHVKKALTNIRERLEHFRGQIVAVKTSAVPYQEIFRWPSKEDWEAVNLRSKGLETFFTPDETPETRKIKERLDVQRITLNFEETPFGVAIDFMKDVTGLNFVVSNLAEEIVEDEGLAVTLKVTNLPLRNALRLILDHNPDLRYSIRYDVIFITTAEDVEEDLYLEFYNVSDIIGKIPDFPAPKLALAPLASSGGGGGTGVLTFDDDDDDDTKGIGVDIDTLIKLIEDSLGEESENSSVEASPGGILVVRHTLEAHRKIQQLLVSLRKTVGIMVTVEARFIDIQDNFLENIGVDYRGLPAQILNVDGSGTNQSIGYRFVDSQQQNDTRAAVSNTFSTNLGSSSANPFNFFETGGVAAQWNVLEDFQLQMIFEAVKKTQKARLVNNPRITVFNTQRSHILVINQEAYIADTEINQTGITPVLNPVIGILNSGSILEARPTVSHDRKYVTLEVKPTLAVDLTTPLNVANLNLSLSFTQIPIELPVLRVQKIRTTVTVPDGGTVIVGGLRDMRRVKNYAGVPILGHIPLIRLMFSRHGESSLKRSIVVLLKADITIIREEEEKMYR
ncbi:MAG: hypothetical protein O7H41_16255 [Planctomycetota bacterium]|nr:hypothetical protein [Planctomycetota bacterium]